MLCGLRHNNFPHFSTTFIGSPSNQNIPFYLHANYPKSREYKYSPLGVSDHFAPGTCSNEFDSMYLVRYSSIVEDYSKPCTYRLDLIDESGKQYSVHRTVSPQTFDVFWLSDILKEIGVDNAQGHWTLWVKSYDTKLKPYHMLYRKSDNAMSLDDGSEGTLQTDPQIGGLEGEKTSFEMFLHAINRTEVAQQIPVDVREKIRRALLRRQ